MTKSYNKYLLCLLAIIMVGCAAKKKAVVPPPATLEPAAEEIVAPRWHTTLISDINANIRMGQQSLNAACLTQVSRDSMLTISIMPILGIEMIRIEATPDSVWVLDKINRRYTGVDYPTLSHYVTPTLKYEDLQNMAAAEDIKENDNRCQYTFAAMGKTLTLTLKYGKVQRDVPMRMTATNRARYIYVEPKELMK